MSKTGRSTPTNFAPTNSYGKENVFNQQYNNINYTNNNININRNALNSQNFNNNLNFKICKSASMFTFK